MAGCPDATTAGEGATASDTGDDADSGTSTQPTAGSGSGTGDAEGTSEGDVSDSGTTSGAVSCEDFAGAVTQAEADATPRGNFSAERIALFFTDDVVVAEDIYERALSDRAVLDALDRLGCPAGTPHSSEILLSFVEHHDDVLDGTYDAWNCANARYGAFLAPIETSPQEGRGAPVVLGLDGVFDTSQILVDYAGLPGVDSVEVIPVDCHGDLERPMAIPGLYGCADGSTWHYWWTDAYPDQAGFPITAGAHLQSEPGSDPVVVCSWGDGEDACSPPACLRP